MRAYAYQCKDYSIATPLFKKVLVTPLIRFIPWGVPANIITIISNSFMYVALFLSINQKLLGRHSFWAVALLMLLYLVGDHLDGAQAKKTGTGSALGEFCDHYLDAFNNGIVVYILFVLLNIDNTLLLVTTLLFSYLAHSAIFYEQFKTGWLIFEKLGSLEGVLISSFLIGICYFEPVYQFMHGTLVFNVTLFEVFFILTSLGALSTFIKTMLRESNFSFSIMLFVILMLITSIFAILLYETGAVAIIITLYASLYIGRLMRGHLIDGKQRIPDIIVPFFLVAIYFSGSLIGFDTVYIIILYLLARIIELVSHVVSPLQDHWVWINPPKKKKRKYEKRKKKSTAKPRARNNKR